MFSHTKKILNIFAFLSTVFSLRPHFSYRINGIGLPKIPYQPILQTYSIVVADLAPHLFLSFCMELHAWVHRTGHVGAVFFSWRLSFALWRRFFCGAFSFALWRRFFPAAIFSPLVLFFCTVSLAYITIRAAANRREKKLLHKAMALFDLNMEQPFEGGLGMLFF
jgi:hypothetical protein